MNGFNQQGMVCLRGNNLRLKKLRKILDEAKRESLRALLHEREHK